MINLRLRGIIAFIKISYIMFPQMAKARYDIRRSAVEYYIHHNTTLGVTAQKYNIHVCTLAKWLKQFRESGDVSCMPRYRRPWNRVSKRLEHRVAMLKEHDPLLTVRKAHELMRKQDVPVSLKGIWSIWKRYGLAGFVKKELGSDFVRFGARSREAEVKLAQAANLLGLKQHRQSAAILNDIPFLPHNDVLQHIPDRYLSIPRRIEKTAGEFGRIAIHTYLKKLQLLYTQLQKKDMRLSALRVAFIEVLALEWSYRPAEQLTHIKKMQWVLNREKGYRSYTVFPLKFLIQISEAIAHVELGQVTQAVDIAKRCGQILARRRKTSPQLLYDMSVLFTYLEDFRKAGQYLEQYLKTQDAQTRERMRVARANILYSSGKYRQLKRVINRSMFQHDWGIKARVLMFQSFIELMEGHPQRAIARATESLMRARAAEINGLMYQAFLLIACSYASIGEADKAQRILKRLLRFLQKKKLRRNIPLLRRYIVQKNMRRAPYPRGTDVLPRVKLMMLLCRGYYTAGYRYAQRKSILTGFFHYAFFFPDDIRKRLMQGRQTFLPQSMLALPAFNRTMPVYDIRILGALCVYRDKKRLRVHLSPKEQSVLVNIAYRCKTPGTRLSVKRICENYWPHNPRASRNLSRILMTVRKALRLPRHMLHAVRREGERVIENRGCFFVTDYDEMKQLIAAARALVRSHEYALAKQEYKRAFRLHRGRPCEKMYDAWSDTLRQTIINLCEHATEEYHKL